MSSSIARAGGQAPRLAHRKSRHRRSRRCGSGWSQHRRPQAHPWPGRDRRPIRGPCRSRCAPPRCRQSAADRGAGGRGSVRPAHRYELPRPSPLPWEEVTKTSRSSGRPASVTIRRTAARTRRTVAGPSHGGRGRPGPGLRIRGERGRRPAGHRAHCPTPCTRTRARSDSGTIGAGRRRRPGRTTSSSAYSRSEICFGRRRVYLETPTRTARRWPTSIFWAAGTGGRTETAVVL